MVDLQDAYLQLNQTTTDIYPIGAQAKKEKQLVISMKLLHHLWLFGNLIPRTKKMMKAKIIVLKITLEFSTSLTCKC